MPSAPRRSVLVAAAALALAPALGLGLAGSAQADSSAVASIARSQVGGDCSAYYGCQHRGQCGADFARWVWSQAGATPMSGIDSRAVSFYQFGRSNGTLHATPQVGDAVVYDSDGSLTDGTANHVNLVVEVSADGTQIKTVGGNESNSVQARGWFDWRTNSSPVGAGRALAFVGPKGLGGPTTPAPTPAAYHGDVPLAGKWDGNGRTQVGVFRTTGGANQFILRHDDGSLAFVELGDRGDQPIVGDWDGTGRTQVGVFRTTGGANEFIMRRADGGLSTVLLGDRGDQPVIGAWDGDGRDLPGIFRRGSGANAFAFRHADGSVTQTEYGNPGDLPVIGDWSGLGRSSFGLYRPGNATFFLSDGYAGAADTAFVFGNGGTWS